MNDFEKTKNKIFRFWKTQTGKFVIISGTAIITFYLSGKLMKLTKGVVIEYKELQEALQR